MGSERVMVAWECGCGMMDSRRRPTNGTRRDGSEVPLSAHSHGFLHFGELQQDVNHTDQAPLALNIREPAQQELPEPARLLDLSKDRFGQGLAKPITAPPTRSCQLRTHCRDARAFRAAASQRIGIAVPLSAGGDVSIDAMASQHREVALGAVTGIGGKLIRLPTGVRLDLLEHRLELTHIGGAVADALCDDHRRLGVHGRLRVVGLHELLAALGHDLALGIGEVALSLRLRSGFAGGSRLGLQLLASLADLLDPALLVRHPLRHLVPAPLAPVLPILRIVGGLGPIEPSPHFPLQSQLRLAHPLITHRLVLARVGLHLRAIVRHAPELDQSRLLTQLQHLHEQPLQGRQVALTKIAHRAKVRPVQSRHRHEVHPVLARLRNALGRVHPLAVSVQQQCRHHHRVVGRVAPLLLLVRGQNLAKVQLLAFRVAHEMRDVIGRHEVHHRRRQQPALLHVPLTKGLRHAF